MKTGVIGIFLPVALLEHFRIMEVSELGEVSAKKIFYKISLNKNYEIFLIIPKLTK